MATYVLPNTTAAGGRITVQGNSLAEAQQAAAQQTGVTIQQQQAGKTFGADTFQAGTTDGGGGGGAPPVVGGNGAATDALLRALASGNKAAADEAIREYNATHQLDQARFDEGIRQYNQNFGITQAGITGMYNGQPTMAMQQQQFQQALDAAGLTGMYQGAPTLASKQLGLDTLKVASGLQANPFLQSAFLYGAGQNGLSSVMQAASGQGGVLPSFQAPQTGSAAYSATLPWLTAQSMPGSYTQQQTADWMGNLPTPGQTNWTALAQAPTATSDLVVQGLAQKWGLDESTVRQIGQKTMPQFQAPTLAGSTRI